MTQVPDDRRASRCCWQLSVALSRRGGIAALDDILHPEWLGVLSVCRVSPARWKSQTVRDIAEQTLPHNRLKERRYL